jgi:hypothetical protein
MAGNAVMIQYFLRLLLLVVAVVQQEPILVKMAVQVVVVHPLPVRLAVLEIHLQQSPHRDITAVQGLMRYHLVPVVVAARVAQELMELMPKVAMAV